MKKDIYKNLPVFNLAKLIKTNHTKKKNKGVIFGNFGAMNFGDEAILTGELNGLSKLKNVEVCVVSRNVEHEKNLHNINALSLYDLKEIISELLKSDFVIVGGGGIICKADRGLIGFSYQLYVLFLYLFMPLVFRKKIYVTGLGVYQNANPFILLLATNLIRFADVVTVRDYHSFEYLKIKKINAKLYKDNSFLMELPPAKEILKDKFFRENYNKDKINIGFALLKPDNKNSEKYLISQVTNFIEKNYKKANFWFYACDYQKGYFNDETFAKRIYKNVYKKLNKKVSCFFIPTNWSPEKFFSSFRLMDFFISMRLHAMIYGYRNKIDFLGISYDKKTSSFLESIGKEEIKIDNTNWQLASIKL